LRSTTLRITIIGFLLLSISGFYLLYNPINGSSIESPLSIPPAINVLLMVTDQVSGCTDSMMVVNINPKSSRASILSIPRDTEVTVDGDSFKINAAYSIGKLAGDSTDGINLVKKCISQLIDVKIDYYAVMKLDCISSVVDELDGVTYDVPFDMKYTALSQHLFIDIKKGEQLMNGDKVIQLLRFRHPNGPLTQSVLNSMKGYDGGDTTRQDNNQKFMKEFFKQKATPQYFLNLNKMKNILNIIVSNTVTDLTFKTALSYAKVSKCFAKSSLNAFRMRLDELPGYSYKFNNTVLDNSHNKIIDAKKVIKKYFGV